LQIDKEDGQVSKLDGTFIMAGPDCLLMRTTNKLEKVNLDTIKPETFVSYKKN